MSTIITLDDFPLSSKDDSKITLDLEFVLIKGQKFFPPGQGDSFAPVTVVNGQINAFIWLTLDLSSLLPRLHVMIAPLRIQERRRIRRRRRRQIILGRPLIRRHTRIILLIRRLLIELIILPRHTLR